MRSSSAFSGREGVEDARSLSDPEEDKVGECRFTSLYFEAIKDVSVSEKYERRSQKIKSAQMSPVRGAEQPE